MEIALIILSVLMLLYGLLAVFDGFYLHIFKYQLHNHSESKNEHLVHTVRAVLFPTIVYFLFLRQDSTISFYVGIFLVLLDILVLSVDAFMEKDSRTFMGGLPRWEYILHLFINGFHFATIAVYLAIKITITENSIHIIPNFNTAENWELFRLISINMIPGAIFLALLHIIISIPKTAFIWNTIRLKIVCC